MHYKTMKIIQYNCAHEYNTTQYNATQYNNLQRSASTNSMKCNAGQFRCQWNTIRYKARQCNEYIATRNTMWCNEMQHNYNALQFKQHNTMKYNATRHKSTQQNTIQYHTNAHNRMQCNVMQNTGRRYDANAHANTIQYIATQRNIIQGNSIH